MNINYGFSNNLLNRSDPGGYSVGQFNRESGSYSKTENADITIITDDGDRVTISSDRSMDANYSSYIGLLRSGSSMAKAQGYEYQNQLHSNFTMSIVGDLDSEEYDDIMSALETIDSVMEIAFTINVDDLQAVTEKLGGLDSLSGLSASIEVTESVNYEKTQSVVSDSEPEGRGHKGHDCPDKLDHALVKILDSGKNHGKANGHIKHLMNEYLAGLLDSMSEKSGKKEQIHKAGEIIKDMIMDRLGEKTGDLNPT